jgi:hypothetical protein
MEWEQLTPAQQQTLIDILQETGQEIRDQYEEEINRLEQHARQGSMQARQDTSGLTRQPIPPVPDVKRDAAFEKLALDTHRLVTYFAYLKAADAHLKSKGFDLGVALSEYMADRTDSLPEGRVKAMAKVMEQVAARPTSGSTPVQPTSFLTSPCNGSWSGTSNPGSRSPCSSGCAACWGSTKPSAAGNAHTREPRFV